MVRKLAEARAEAESILADDPDLSAHSGLARAIDRRLDVEDRAAMARN